jgi:hypothetical protein
MSLLAPLKLAVMESLRPTFTSQLGPPIDYRRFTGSVKMERIC